MELEHSLAPDQRTPTGWHKFWEDEHSAARKRLRSFHRQGNSVNSRYVGRYGPGNADLDGVYGIATAPSRPQSVLNLFHTNIKTLASMLCGSIPKPDVSREHQDPDDDVARVAAVLYERILSADVKPSGEDLSAVLKNVLLDRLVPGLGVARVRYDFQTQEIPTLDPQSGDQTMAEQVVWEDAPIEYVNWQDFLWGWARTWQEVPWIAFRNWLTKEEVTARFGEEVADKLQYQIQNPMGDDNRDHPVGSEYNNNVAKAQIWEVWYAITRKVYWFSPGATKILDEKDDPLQLNGFWPIPKPLMANLTTTLLVPTPDFALAQDLYNEIDILQSRIAIITRACKVVGVYDSSAEEIDRMLTEGVENDLIPVDNWAMLAEKGGLQGSIGWFPIQDIANVLGILRQLLGETIELLYQVTGMSDILRGANTDQYTSDGTNQLKAKFGSIRIQALQDEFARFASDLAGLKAEVVSKHFKPQSILQQSNARYLPQADIPLIGPSVGLMQSPDIQWRVNIRPESIAMVDYAQLKAERTEFLTAMATYVQSAQAAAREIPGALPVLLELLKWGMAGYKGADYLEGTMDQAIEQAKQAAGQPQQDQQAQAEQAKLQAEQLKLQGIQMKGQMELQKVQLKAQTDFQNLQAKVQGELAKIRADAQADQTLENLDAQNEIAKIEANLMASLREIQASLAADLQIEEAQSTMAIAEKEVEFANDVALENLEHRNALAQTREAHNAQRQQLRELNPQT